MSRNTSIVIGKADDKFIKSQIKKGRFGSASEAMRAGLRLLEEQELKIERLRNAIEEGEASGPATAFNMRDYLKSKRAAH
jgi:antitoxin ParD1/3/4